MRKRIIFVSILGLITLIGFNNCGEGFQSLQLEESALSSTNTTNPGPTPINQVQINLITEPEAVTYKVDQQIEFEVKNLTDTDQISCKLNNALLDQCDSPLELTNLTDGAQKLEILVNNGNCETCFKIVEWDIKMSTVDTTPIEVTLDSAPEKETESTTATFIFSFSEAPDTMKCKLNGNVVIDCSNPQTFNEVPEGENLFEIIVTDAANNETTETFDWQVIKRAPEPGALVLDFQIDKSGKGVIKYNRAVDQDMTFTISLKFNSPVKDFLRVFYKEPIAPFTKNIDVTISSGEKEQVVDLEYLFKPIKAQGDKLPYKLTIEAEVFDKISQKKIDSLSKLVEFPAYSNSAKAAYSTIYYSMLVNYNNLITVQGHLLRRGDRCDFKLDPITDGNLLVGSDGGQGYFYIYTDKNYLIKVKAKGCTIENKMKLAAGIIINKIVSTYGSDGFFLTDNHRIFEIDGYNVNTKKMEIEEVKINDGITTDIATTYQSSYLNNNNSVLITLNTKGEVTLILNKLHKKKVADDTIVIESYHDGIMYLTKEGKIKTLEKINSLTGIEITNYSEIDNFSELNVVSMNSWHNGCAVILIDKIHNCRPSNISLSPVLKPLKFLSRGSYSWSFRQIPYND